VSRLAPRFVDRGAITAAYVGIGMAVTIAISFLLIIPIEPIVWLLALPSGMLIGYYANQRSDRRAGPWSRILINGLFAALLTGVTVALMLLAVKALFFYADNGYRDASAGGSIQCVGGAACVYERHLRFQGRTALEEAGIIDVESFSAAYWSQQTSAAGLIVGITSLGGLVGAGLYGLTRPRAERRPAGSTETTETTAAA
jgi:hypothetical protein